MRWFFRGSSASEKRQGGEGGGTSSPGVSFSVVFGGGDILNAFLWTGIIREGGYF